MAGMTKLTPKRHQTIIKMVERGHYEVTAAKAVGISQNTLGKWMQKGREEQVGIYNDFMVALEEARAKGESMLVDHVVGAVANGDWRAAAWILERKYGEHWRKKSEVAVTGKDGGPVEIQPVSEERVLKAYEDRLNLAEISADPMFE